MNWYTTEIIAIDPMDGELKAFRGPYVPGLTFKDAQRNCDLNGMGYCRVDGKINMDISFDGKQVIDYTIISLN
jgi:hypothetical protein